MPPDNQNRNSAHDAWRRDIARVREACTGGLVFIGTYGVNIVVLGAHATTYGLRPANDRNFTVRHPDCF